LALAGCSIALFPLELAEYVSIVAREGGYVRPVARARAEVAKTLDALPGQHVVMLRYSPTHCVHFEWVYNSANIYEQHVIWAHEMGPEWDRAFLASNPARQYWILEPDQSPPKLARYSEAMPSIPAKRVHENSGNLDSVTCPEDLFAPSGPMFLVDRHGL